MSEKLKDIQKDINEYNKDKRVSDKQVMFSVRTLKYGTGLLLMTGALVARAFLAIPRN